MMDRRKRIKVLLIITGWEIAIILILCKWVLIFVNVISLIYAFWYTYKYYVWWDSHTKKKKKMQHKNLEKSLQVRDTKKVSDSSNSAVQTGELSIVAKSICGASIALDEVDSVDGETFETILYNRFRSMKFMVYFTPTSGDFGADLIVEMKDLSVAIQCKRYNYKNGRTVGVKAIQEVLGAMYYYGTQRGMVITNAVYTQSARDLARAIGTITLWDREDLKKYMNFI